MTDEKRAKSRRTSRTIAITALLALITAATVAPGANAMDLYLRATGDVVAADCVGTWVWNFTPDLGVSGQSGTVRVWTLDAVPNVCPYAAVSGLGASEGISIGGGSFEAPYVGDCVHATVFLPDGEIHIVGSSTIVGLGGSNGVIWQLFGVFAVPPCIVNGISEVTLSAEYVGRT